MMEPVIEVTSVKASRRWQGVYLVSLSNDDSFLCPDDLIVSWSLRKGQTLSTDQVTELLAESEEALAKRSAINLLAVRPRSAFELERGLKQKGFGPQAVTTAVSRMQELGYVDDASYAQRLAEELERRGKLGFQGVRRELVQRGIARDVVDSVLDDQIDPESDKEKALALAKRRFNSYKGLPALARERRLAGYLSRRGYSAEIVKWCIEQLNGEVDSES